MGRRDAARQGVLDGRSRKGAVPEGTASFREKTPGSVPGAAEAGSPAWASFPPLAETCFPPSAETRDGGDVAAAVL
jgi:hypothetical protein